jgi:DnaJ-class molecular chaperone
MKIYPPPYNKKKDEVCPRCNGTGIVRDLKTGMERPCVGCNKKKS